MSDKDNDDINHPSHYTSGGMEVWDILKAKLTPEQYYGFMYGNALKYLFRHEHKGHAIKDLEKAAVYTNKCKQILESQRANYGTYVKCEDPAGYPSCACHGGPK